MISIFPMVPIFAAWYAEIFLLIAKTYKFCHFSSPKRNITKFRCLIENFLSIWLFSGDINELRILQQVVHKRADAHAPGLGLFLLLRSGLPLRQRTGADLAESRALLLCHGQRSRTVHLLASRGLRDSLVDGQACQNNGERHTGHRNHG